MQQHRSVLREEKKENKQNEKPNVYRFEKDTGYSTCHNGVHPVHQMSEPRSTGRN
jgi:hypothetical protein